MKTLFALSLFMLSVFSLPSYAQTAVADQFVSNLEIMRSDIPREKLFIHRDRDSYFVGDTVWFRGFVLRSDSQLAGDSIDVAYIEIIDTEGRVINRVSTTCFWGGFNGQFVLSEADYAQGDYTIRAYTNWMRNYSDSTFFQANLRVLEPISEEWRVRMHDLELDDGRLQLSASLLHADGSPRSGDTLAVRLMDGRRKLMDVRILTGPSGNIRLDTLFSGSIRTSEVFLEFADNRGFDFRVPVPRRGDNPVDLQFLPEGGNWVSGISQRMAFKALDQFGRGVDIGGVIVDANGTEIMPFATAHRGMGQLEFIPQMGEHYTAILEDGTKYVLPAVEKSGSVLRIDNSVMSDSIVVRIEISEDLYGAALHFMAEARESIGIRGITPPLAGIYERAFPKKLFPSGVVRFTVLDERMRELNGRSVFVWHDPVLSLNLQSDKLVYGTRDSVGLSVHVKDANGQPVVQGSFSVAVIDTSQVGFDRYGENLVSYMFLGSDLQGKIEDPYYYLSNPGGEEVDLLMMTQGWVRYTPTPITPAYARENGFSVKGLVVNALGRPVDGSAITLMGRIGQEQLVVMDTVTGAGGEFSFNDFPQFFSDTALVVLKATDRRGKAFGIRIDVDEQEFPQINETYLPQYTHDLLFSDTTSHRLADNRARILAEASPGSVLIDEVLVTAQLQVPGSKNLNPGGGADQIILREEFDDVLKKTLLDLLYERVDGFGKQFVEGAGEYIPNYPSGPRSRGQVYSVGQNYARFVIDGTELSDLFYPAGRYLPDATLVWLPHGATLIEDFDPRGYIEYLDPYLNYFVADDIQGIEVMSSLRYKGRYQLRHAGMKEQYTLSSVGRGGLSFIEITTRLGTGPFLNRIPGEYRYFPVVPIVAKTFYSPRYPASNADETKFDVRPTLYWNPEILVEQGETNFSFYTSDNVGGYLVVIQGTDLSGGLGVSYHQLTVE